MELFLEMSRKCNMSCSHCLRGDAQNKTMPEYIGRLALQKLGNDYIGIGGGETLASSKLVKTLRDWLLKEHMFPSEIYLVTNGLGLWRTPKIMETVANLPTKQVWLHVSTDRWHCETVKGESAKSRYHHVKDLADVYEKITVNTHGANEFHNLLSMGRYASSGKEEEIFGLENRHLLYVDIYGYVWVSCNLSYAFMDKFRDSPLCLGNVLTDSAEAIHLNNQVLDTYIPDDATCLYVTENSCGVKETEYKLKTKQLKYG